VFMIGEGAGFPGFKENVVRAVMEAKLHDQFGEPVVHERDKGQNLYVASRGAAELARRVLVAPTACGIPDRSGPLARCRP
jgi:hypothetical protein